MTNDEGSTTRLDALLLQERLYEIEADVQAATREVHALKRRVTVLEHRLSPPRPSDK